VPKAKTEAANEGGLNHSDSHRESSKLLECVSYAIKRPFYSGASGLHGDDDRDRNSSSDETILDGGRPGVIFEETQDKLIHLKSSLRVIVMHAKNLYSGKTSPRFKPLREFY
jgi:hypothetical protein